MSDDFEAGELAALLRAIEEHKARIEGFRRSLKEESDPSNRADLEAKMGQEQEALNAKAEEVRALRQRCRVARRAGREARRPPPGPDQCEGSPAHVVSKQQGQRLSELGEPVKGLLRASGKRRSWLPLRRLKPRGLPPPGPFSLWALLWCRCWENDSDRLRTGCRALGQALGVSRQTVSRRLAWLEQNGFIDRHPGRIRTGQGWLPQIVALKQPTLVGTIPRFAQAPVEEVDDLFQRLRSGSLSETEFRIGWIELAWTR